jgi:hypothetical protein
VADVPDRKSKERQSGMSVGCVGLLAHARLRAATAKTVRNIGARIRLGTRASTIPR